MSDPYDISDEAGGESVKRYPWEWCTGRRLAWLRGGGTRWLWATWGEWLGGERMLYPILPLDLAERVLRRRSVRWFKSREQPASCVLACCGRGGWAMKWNKLIPFFGSRMLHYEGDAGWDYDPATKQHTARPVEWRPQAEFTATLRFVKWHHGRSAAYADFEDVGSGAVYPVSLASTGEFMARLVGGCATGHWIAMKRGQNYLLEFLGPTP